MKDSPRHILATFAVFLAIFVGYCCIAPGDRERLSQEVALVAQDVETASMTIVEDPELAADLADLSIILTDVSKALKAGETEGVSVAIAFVEGLLVGDRIEDDELRLAVFGLLSTLRRVEAYSGG